MIERAILISTLMLGLAGLLAALARRASASVRHTIWLVGLTTAIGVAIASPFKPVIEVETTVVNGPAVVAFDPGFVRSLQSAFPEAGAPVRSAAAPVAPRVRIDTGYVILAIYLAGVALILGRVVIGHIAIARLVRRSRPFAGSGAGARVDVRVSADVDAPFTLGARRPVILLPADAESWDEARLRIVLVHELAHVARLDYVAQLVGTIACAIYWFNPITWLAASRLRAEAEHAADDRVLAAGVDGVTYASHLLELARPDEARLATAMAVGMARGNRLERRFTAMLDSTRSRGTVPLRFQAIAGSAALMVAIPLTALRVVPAIAPVAKSVAVPTAPITAVAPPVVVPTRRAAAGTHPSTIAERQRGDAARGTEGPPRGNPSTREEADSVFERTLAAAPGERIAIDLRMGGGVTVHAWDQAQVRMRAVLSGDHVRDTRVTFARAGGGLELRAYMGSYPNNSRNSNSFELWVPRKFDVSISSAGGAIAIDGVEGRFSGQTGGGEITLENVKGEASLTTGGGEVQVTRSALDGRVTTGGGKAIVTSTTGNVRVSSGSGPVIRTTDDQARVYGVGGLSATTSIGADKPLIIADGQVISGGNVSFSSAGGDIRLQDVPNGGSFNTGGGEIVIGAVGGRASFTTGGGNITLNRVSGDVSATTGAGEVQITVIDGNGTARSVSVSSGTGRVTIDLPSNLDARFDIETSYTERHGPTTIKSDFSLNTTETDEWDSRNGTPRRYVRGNGVIGSGRGLIRVRTVNGDVIIRKR
jgi:beta-lactamase regulating signal transducer with metallopeptidase domain/DUF4097 and DUF4098 domain-containing protein YvlB